MQNVKNSGSNGVLVIGPAWVGDFIMAQSLFRVLKTCDPSVAIDVVAPPWTIPLSARMPEVREGLELPLGHGVLGLSTRWRLGQKLRDRNYQRAIVLPRSFKAAVTAFATRATRRTGYLGEMRWGLLNDIRPRVAGRTVDSFVALGLEPGEGFPNPIPFPRLTANPENAATVLDRLGVRQPTGPVLALCPGAEYGPAKRWPVAHFAEVARRVVTGGCQVWLFGSSRDAIITAEIQELSGRVAIDLAGRVSIVEALDLLALTSVIVTNDSGLMHLAAALERPLVALFGSSDPRHTPPLSFHATILHHDLACAPCFQRTCPQNHLKCLNELTPDEIIDNLPPSIVDFHK